MVTPIATRGGTQKYDDGERTVATCLRVEKHADGIPKSTLDVSLADTRYVSPGAAEAVFCCSARRWVPQSFINILPRP